MGVTSLARKAVRKPLQAVGVLKSDRTIIKEIHEAFHTAPERIAEECRNSKAPDISDIKLKADRLKKAGFTRSKRIKDENKLLFDAQMRKNLTLNKKGTLEALEYFQQKYPQYKFITEEEVKSICHKYRLIYGAIDRFKGDVPEKNLQDVENFSIDLKDECWVRVHNGIMGPFDTRMGGEDAKRENDARRETMFMSSARVTKEGLEIAAPMQDFELEGMELHGLKLREQPAKDPVVLAPVIYKNTKYYLVVTAWGPEASDELVVNQKMN